MAVNGLSTAVREIKSELSQLTCSGELLKTG
jgi:hypothetical protein